ncbi:hypothetical protein CEE44_02285 [Candidatus Woesearchaeota archaeon B3_Woes]|nr:MAG: hypothetical protein CEE44_02285 [Candidatus Woesearchaeota archaeon B3_Woes]
MKIALLPTTFLNESSESSHITLILLARELKKKGHDVCIISEGVKNFPEYEIFQGIKIYRGPTFSIRPDGSEVRFLNALNRIISPIMAIKKLSKRGIEFDIIHNFSAARFLALKSLFAKRIIKNKDAKIIHTLKSYSRFKLGNKFTRLLNSSDLITVPTKRFAKDILKKGTTKTKVKVINSYIDSEKFKSIDKKIAKKKINIKEDFILYYGGLLENKGPKILIEAMKKVFEENDNLKLVMIIRHKKHKIFEEYKKLMKSLNIEKKVLFIKGELHNVEYYINSAEIVVLPYINLIATEGNPSCILETIACKTPLITTDLPELREIVDYKKDVLMAKPNNVEDLSKEINKLLKDKKLQKRLSENAYKKSKEFDFKKITMKFIKLYEGLLNGS